MKISKEVRIERKNGTFIVYTLDSLAMLMGTRSATNNLHIHKIKKKNGVWLVPATEVDKRIATIEVRIDEWKERLDTMKEIKNGGRT